MMKSEHVENPLTVLAMIFILVSVSLAIALLSTSLRIPSSGTIPPQIPPDDQKSASYIISIVESGGATHYCMHYYCIQNGTVGKLWWNSTDDDAVIQYAIDNVVLDGGIVFVRQGTYSASVTVKSNVTLMLEVGVSGVRYSLDGTGMVLRYANGYAVLDAPLNMTQHQITFGVFRNGTSFPSSSKEGQWFYKTTDHNLYVYNSTHWVNCFEGGTGSSDESELDYDYLMYVLDGIYYAKNGATGQIDYEGDNASYIMSKTWKSNRLIRIAEGDYNLTNYQTWHSGYLLWDVQNLTVIGAGMKATMFHLVGQVGHLDEGGAINIRNCTNVRLSNLGLDAHAGNGKASRGFHVVRESSYIHLDNLYVTRTHGTAIALNSGDFPISYRLYPHHVFVINCYVNDTARAEGGIAGEGNCLGIYCTHHSTVAFNSLYRSGSGQNGIDLYTNATDNLVFGNTVEDCFYGISLENDGRGWVRNNTISHNILKEIIGAGIQMCSWISGQSPDDPRPSVEYNTISFNYVKSNGTPARSGIKLYGKYYNGNYSWVRFNKIIGNTFVDWGCHNDYHGIKMFSGYGEGKYSIHGNEILDNTLIHCGFDNSGATGIRASGENNTFTRNHLYNCGVEGAATVAFKAYGRRQVIEDNFFEDSGSILMECPNYIFSNNTIHSSGGLSINGENNGTISGNYFVSSGRITLSGDFTRIVSNQFVSCAGSSAIKVNSACKEGVYILYNDFSESGLSEIDNIEFGLTAVVEQIRYNRGYTTENYGTVEMNNNSTVTFNHGLIGAATNVSVSFNGTGWGSWEWTSTSTQITITAENSVNATVYWEAVRWP